MKPLPDGRIMGGMWHAFVVVVALLASPELGRAATREAGPDQDWCAAARDLEPGDELLLRGGEYAGPCTLTRGGAPGAPIVIRAKDAGYPPRIVQVQTDVDALSIRASYLTLNGLDFGPTLPDVDAVRILGGTSIVVENCRFADIGGVAVVATHDSLTNVVVRNNDITRTGWTAIYFGCHDGLKCQHSGIVIERNYIHGVAAPAQGPASDPGGGIQIKLNTTAVVRDNVIVDTLGPSILVYGMRDLGRPTVVERNLAMGSRTEAGIWLGGGPVLVRNNVAVGSLGPGIELQDYARRGLLRGIVIAHNTVYGNATGGISVAQKGRVQVKIVNNAVHARGGAPPIPIGRAGVLSLGNADCTLVPCFVDPEIRDFSPLAVRSGLWLGETWMPTDDYFGRPRGEAPTVGAVDQQAGPVRLGIKAQSP